MIGIVAPSRVSAAQDEAHRALDKALRLADLYNWAAAATDFTEAERLFVATDDQRDALYARLGKLRATVEQNERALPTLSAELAEELQTNQLLKTDRRLRLFALVVKGDIDAEIDTAAMKADWTNVKALADEVGDSKWQYRAIAQLGLAAFYDADLETARKNVSSAVLSASKAGDRGALIRYLTATGIGLVNANMAQQALPYFESALKIAAGTPESGYPFLTMHAKVAALRSLGRLDEAERLATEVVAEARQTSRRANEAMALQSLAHVQIARGNDSAALRMIDEGIAIAEPSGLARVLAELQDRRAVLLARRGDLDAAETAARSAADVSQSSGEFWSVPRRLQFLGDLYERRGKYDKAGDIYDRAGAFVDAMIGKASTVIDKTVLISASGDIFARYFSLVVDHFDDIEKAFSIVEQVRGRPARDLLLAGTHRAPAGAETERNISRLRLRLMSARSTEEVRKLRDEIFLAEQARWTQPGMSTLKVSVSADVKLVNVRSALKPSDVILTFVLAHPRSYCLVITSESARVVPLRSREVIDHRIAAYRKAVESNLPATHEARSLYQLLLQPIREFGLARRLIVVRDGSLHLIPFDALVAPSGAYVLQNRTVEYAPSASTYYLLTRSREQQDNHHHPTTALAVGGIPYSSSNLAAGDLSRGYRSAFPTLPSSADEVLTVRSAIGSSRTTVLLGSKATETALTGTNLQDYTVVHLAVHALANAIYPDRAALVLLSDKQAGDDGFLQSPEIAQLTLRADLVVLSACETAAGTVEGQEGVANLSRAFLLAGARSVVSSLWQVDDKSSLYLMRRFYARIANGASFGAALAEAKKDILRDFGPNALPNKWAGLTLEGLGSARLSDARGRQRAR